MKKTITFLILITGILILTGCGNNPESSNGSDNELVKKFNQINVGMTKTEINNILTVSDEANGKYENGSITVSFNGNTVSILHLQLSHNAEEIKNTKTNLANAEKLINKLNNGEKLYYQDLVNSFKTEGVCTSKVKDGCSRYQWADSNGNYMTASINVYSDGHVITMNGKA